MKKIAAARECHPSSSSCPVLKSVLSKWQLSSNEPGPYSSALISYGSVSSLRKCHFLKPRSWLLLSAAAAAAAA